MDYEIVSLQEKRVAGYTARTSNTDPAMNTIIGGLWKRLFEGGAFFTMPNKVDDHSIGLYSNYENDCTGLYDITVGCAVSSGEPLAEGMELRVIPAGRYAKFVLLCEMDSDALCKAWGEIWTMPLDRAYTGDFEEYVTSAETGPVEIHIYIALR